LTPAPKMWPAGSGHCYPIDDLAGAQPTTVIIQQFKPVTVIIGICALPYIGASERAELFTTWPLWKIKGSKKSFPAWKKIFVRGMQFQAKIAHDSPGGTLIWNASRLDFISFDAEFQAALSGLDKFKTCHGSGC